MANKHMKRWSAPLFIRKIEIKTTVRCHHILTKKAKIKNTDNTKCWQE